MFNQYKQFPLIPWQAFALTLLFGWYWKGKPQRKHYKFFLFVARKNAKTVFAVCILKYMMMGRGEEMPNCYLIANSQKQSGVALKYAKTIRSHSPFLVDNTQTYQYHIKYDQFDGTLEALHSRADNLDSLNVHAVCIDEIHEMETMDLIEVMESGSGNRVDPLILLTTTAGFHMEYPITDIVDHHKAILKGEADVPDEIGLLFTLDEQDDYENSDHWIKANPSIGYTLTKETLERQYRTSKPYPSSLKNFLVKNLNTFADSTDDWLPLQLIRDCSVRKDLTDYAGYNAWMAYDLSKTRDLTSVVLLVHDGRKFIAFPYFFCPKDVRRLRPGGVDLYKWIRKEYIIECETKTVDYEVVFNKIKMLADMFAVQRLFYDGYNAAPINNRIEQLGIETKAIPQTAMHYNQPIKHLEKMFFEDQIVLNDSPVMTWNFGNAVLYEDGNGNVKFLKNKSRDSIDGLVSLAMAMKAWLVDNNEDESAFMEEYKKMMDKM